MFVSHHAHADIGLTTPMTQCCNCGARRPLQLLATPMRITRYLLVAGSEFTLTETFPYCPACKASATRVRGGWFHRLLVWAMAAAAVFLFLLFSPFGKMPAWFDAHIFAASLLLGVLPEAAYYGLWARDTPARAHYQPVRLLGTESSGQRLTRVRLWFHNPRYAQQISDANAEAVQAGFLQVLTPKR